MTNLTIQNILWDIYTRGGKFYVFFMTGLWIVFILAKNLFHLIHDSVHFSRDSHYFPFIMLDTLPFYYYVPRISEQTNLCLYYIIAARHQNSTFNISNINEYLQKELRLRARLHFVFSTKGLIKWATRLIKCSMIHREQIWREDDK